MLRRSLSIFVLLFAVACGPGGPGGDPEIIAYTTRDTLVDHSEGANVGAPRLCVAGPNVFAVWHDDRRGSDRNQVFFNVGRGGGALWNDVDTQLSSDPNGDSIAENAAIACAGESVYVVWEDDRDSEFGNKSVYFSYSDDSGETWEVDRLVTTDPNGDYDAQGPQVAVQHDPDVSPDKQIYFVWFDNRSGAYDVFFTRSTNGYNFLASEVRVDTDPPGAAYSGEPVLGIDNAGGVYIAWEDSRGGGNDVHFNSSDDEGDSWGTDARLDGGDGAGESDAFGISMAIDVDADTPVPYVAWHDSRNGANDIYLNHRSTGAWQSDAIRIDGGGEGGAESFYPSVYATDGRVLVAWHDDRDIGFDILIRGSENGGADWGSETRLDTDVAGSAHSLGAKLAGVGDNVAAVWTDYRRPTELLDAQPDLYLRTSNDGGFLWSGEDVRIDDDPQGTGISDDPQVVMSGPAVYTLWVDYRAGNADLYFRRMSSNQ
ncbi:MAG: exo-alpha-sialidase [Proteobacteria bacterium]|nr:exo-alpha-sialidase [Pseudomonadota bacterium]